MHINSNDLNNFQNEEMNTDEIIAFLEHMNHCDYCLNQLVDEYTDHASSAPAYLKGTIMERVTAPDIQIQKTAADATYKMRFFYEGLRTVVGVVLALVMLFSLGQMDFVSPQLPQSTAKSSETRREIRTSLRNFSNGIIAIAGGLNISSLVIFLPVLWFYSFFHVHNLKELPEEEFYAIEDNYILHLDRIFQNNIRLSQKHIKIAAILLIVFGVAVFWNGFRDLLFWILPNSLAIIIQDIMYQIPSVIIGILIIVAGYQLLTGKIKSISPDEKADCKKDVSEHYWQPYRPYQQPVDNSAPQMNTKSAPASTVSSTTQPDQNADNVIKNTDIKISDTTSVQPFITAEPDNNSAK